MSGPDPLPSLFERYVPALERLKRAGEALARARESLAARGLPEVLCLVSGPRCSPSFVARWNAAAAETGVATAQAEHAAASAAMFPLDRGLVDTKPTTLAGAIVKLRFALTLLPNPERDEDADCEVRAIREALAFLESVTT